MNKFLLTFGTLLLPTLFVTGGVSAQTFTIGAIPDTQIQSLNDAWNASFIDQTSYFRDRAGDLALVTHLGDVVQGELGGLELLIPQFAWEQQFGRTDTAIGQLDLANTLDGNVLPYSVSLGNHDLLPTGEKSNSSDPISPSGFTNYYGPGRYAGMSWYQGSDSTGQNHAQLFDAGPYTYLHINLEHEPQDPTAPNGIVRTESSAIAWAQSVIDANPDVPTIITSHKLLTDLEPEGFDVTGYAGDGIDDTFGGERTPTGQAVFDQLVRPNAQVFMTLNGHEHEGPYREDGEYHQVSTNDAGLPVFEVMANYQDYVNPLTGSDPYVRLIDFDINAGTIVNRTYSPTFAAFADDPQAVADRLDFVLDEFEAGVPVIQYLGEDIAGTLLFEDLPSSAILAEFLNTSVAPGFAQLSSRAEAELAILSFFGVTDRSELDAIPFSPYLTDADSQFTFDVAFDSTGRPIPEPSSLVLFGLGGLLAARRRRRVAGAGA
ncbi:MAG: PEP-CTERM sorting domain-containing protein [Phycisphaeraceae bacterium]|nr:PEP-CTERM sorting domain-containing protein [Phycisphaeraceae bacterium]